MNGPCESPVPFETLADYFAGELPEPEEQAIESHLFRCRHCSSSAERLAGLVTVVAARIPPVLSASRLADLERDGLVESVNEMTPGQTAHVLYPVPGRLLVHRFSGVDLARARRVDVHLRTKDGEATARFDDVPFDPERGEVLVACQAHFADLFPHEVVFAVEIVSEAERREAARYTVLHRRR
jgi:hypothetical protein